MTWEILRILDFRSLFADVQRSRKRRVCGRPAGFLERLEDRTLLATITPTAFTDGQIGGSLREAVLITNLDTAVDTISLNAGTYTLSIAGRDENNAFTGDLDIRGNLIIQGAGSTQTFIDASSVDRVFDILPGHTVDITGVTIRGGEARGLSSGGALNDGHGGGIQNAGFLTLTDVVVSGNFARDYSSWGYGGGIFNTKSLTLNNSTVTGNQTLSAGGGITSTGFGSTVDIDNSLISGNNNGWVGGGGIANFDGSTLTVTNSTISANTGGPGVGIYNGNSGPGLNPTAHITDTTVDANIGGGTGSGGGIYNNGTFTVTRSTISNNRIPGGSLQPAGGGIDNAGGTLTIANSTISGNQATGVAGGGIHVRGGNVDIDNSTIAYNTAAVGGGIGGVAPLGNLRNTIVGNNSAGSGNDIAGTVNADFSLIEDSSAVTIIGSDNVLNLDPVLGSLTDNGGPTLTHALLQGSPALNQGDNTAAPATDQRGQARIQGGVIDIGSYESSIIPVELDFGDAPDPAYGTLLASDGARHVLGSGLFLGATVDSEADGQPAADAGVSGTTGDDGDGTDDEDGLTLNTLLIPGQPMSFTIDSSAPGFVDAWIDLNGDGLWTHPDEQFLASAPVEAGNSNDFTDVFPADAAFGNTFARVRLSSTGGLLPTGLADDGEVEDYQLTIETVNRFIVNSVGDAVDANLGDNICETATPGECTLRAAIQQANATANLAAGPDVIIFDITGAGPHTITPLPSLPTITDPVVIDGTTEPDSAGTPVVQLDGSSLAGGVGLGISAGGSTVRGLVISNFPASGINIDTAGGNRIAGNYIGTNVLGNLAAPNGGSGVRVTTAGNIIGGEGLQQGNVISGNSANGVLLVGAGATGNSVLGNYIGTSADGSASIGNANIGINVQSAGGNSVGGITNGAGNVISGNGVHGLQLSGGAATGNAIEGNLIGLNADGDAALANTIYGVFVINAPSNTVGGAASGAGNTISGNSFHGVLVRGTLATGNTVQGNQVGTNLDGTGAVANSAFGVYFNTASGNSLVGNVVSGNTIQGVRLDNADNAVVQGNLIGVDIGGNTALPNGSHGLQIGMGTSGAQIGGSGAGQGNVISGNSGFGLFLINTGTTNNTVEGNLIGLGEDGTTAVGNGSTGVRIFGNPTGNTIGGTTAGTGNTIAHNSSHGVFLSGTSTIENAILGNAIFNNAAMGINLFPGGRTNNDLAVGNEDGDVGSNRLQNFPVFDAAVLGAGTIDVTFSVPSATGNSAYPLRVEFFMADSSNQEGETFLDAVTYAAVDALQAVTETITIPAGVTVNPGQRIVATATDDDGNTSEFSLNRVVTASLLAARGPAANPTGAQTITQAELDHIFAVAVDRLSVTLGDPFHNVTVSIADLPGATLGVATDNSITIDVDAAGHGWFVDATPYDDSEFKLSTNDVTPRPMSDIDLLTVVMHELGHTAGLPDLYESTAAHDLMFGWLDVGCRKTSLDVSLIDNAFAQF